MIICMASWLGNISETKSNTGMEALRPSEVYL